MTDIKKARETMDMIERIHGIGFASGAQRALDKYDDLVLTHRHDGVLVDALRAGFRDGFVSGVRYALHRCGSELQALRHVLSIERAGARDDDDETRRRIAASITEWERAEACVHALLNDFDDWVKAKEGR